MSDVDCSVCTQVCAHCIHGGLSCVVARLCQHVGRHAPRRPRLVSSLNSIGVRWWLSCGFVPLPRVCCWRLSLTRRPTAAVCAEEASSRFDTVRCCNERWYSYTSAWMSVYFFSADHRTTVVYSRAVVFSANIRSFITSYCLSFVVAT